MLLPVLLMFALPMLLQQMSVSFLTFPEASQTFAGIC